MDGSLYNHTECTLGLYLICHYDLNYDHATFGRYLKAASALSFISFQMISHLKKGNASMLNSGEIHSFSTWRYCRYGN